MNLPKLENISTKERGYLLGLFIGDGYANYHEKSRHHSITFTLNSVRDNDIQTYLVFLLKKMNLVFCIVKDKRFNANNIKINSKEFYFYFKEISWKFKNDFFYFDKEFLLGVISGFIDAEGSVSSRSTISIAQKNGSTMQKMKQIANLFSVNCSIRECPNMPSGNIWRGLVSTTFKYLPHCSQKVKRVYSCSS
ncbi:hypothetical protein JXB27_01865 [Candidatus Woesearchaeota archaeon]|nr:hypothetical protein [Candidatus Woesearchaeota archaeon]